MRSGDIVPTDQLLVLREFSRTLDELQQMGITPVVFPPPLANGEDLGRCLARADWLGWSRDSCNFSTTALTESVREAYAFLEPVGKKYHVVNLAGMLCPDGVCRSHSGDSYIYRDRGHLAREGSVALGKKHNFYKMIVDTQ